MDQLKEKSDAILSIVPEPLIPPVAKGQKHTYGLLNALGQQTNLICITDKKSDVSGHAFDLRPLFQNGLRKHFSFYNFRLILRIIQKNNPKSILLEQPYMGLMIRRISKITKIPFSVHAHNVEFLKQKALGNWWWPWVFWLERYTMQRAKYIFFISENDRRLAIRKFKINPQKCFVSPYGVYQNEPIVAANEEVKQTRKKHKINTNETVFLFFGDLKYLQNVEAVENIIHEIQPRLAEKIPDQPYKILICGGGASEKHAEQLHSLSSKNIIYAGFVPDIAKYMQAADVFIHPILHRGGIKIKVIEALGYNKPVVSTRIGALGIDPKACGHMLKVVSDKNWNHFTNEMIALSHHTEVIPKTFFDTYNWNAVAARLLHTLLKN